MAKRPYISSAQRREREARNLATIACMCCALLFAAIIAGAYQIDQARGVSVSQSLKSAGL